MCNILEQSLNEEGIPVTSLIAAANLIKMIQGKFYLSSRLKSTVLNLVRPILRGTSPVAAEV